MKTNGAISVLNLVAGEEVTVTGDFNPTDVHYAETFVVPATVKEFTVKPLSDSKACLLLTTCR